MDIAREFPSLADNIHSDLVDTLGGKVVGRDLGHVWYSRDSRQKVMYSGRVVKVKKKGGGTYVISYWAQNETYDDAIDFEVSKYELAADLVCGDMIFS